MHSPLYFLLCAFGGVLSGIPHTLITPMDLIKCRMQVGEYQTVRHGFVTLYDEARGMSSYSQSIGVFFRGWVPTLVGYCLQGAAKFGFYEFFKFAIAVNVSYEVAMKHMILILLTASAAAEFIADIALAPWEAAKVRIQTSRQCSPFLGGVFGRIWALEGVRGFYKGLIPLWCRQIPYTMMKFTSFENTVRILHSLYLAAHPSASLTKIELLFISLAAGYVAGTLCAIVSHPADTVVSRLNQKDSKNLMQVALEMKCSEIWRGLPLRIAMVGTLTAMQWLVYDGFKVIIGLPTTGGS